MIVTITGHGPGSSAESVPFSDIEKNEKNGVKMYNYTENGEFLLWFDGENWLFPKPVEKIGRSLPNPSIELLNSIDEKLDKLLKLENTKE